MNRLVIRLFLGALLSFAATTVLADGLVSGKRCKENLEPIIKVTADYRTYYSLLNYYSSPVTMQIKKLQLQNSMQSAAKSYIRSVKQALNSCSHSCEGLVLNNGNTFSCENLGDYSPRQIRDAVEKDIAENAERARSENTLQTLDPTINECINDAESELCHQFFFDEAARKEAGVTINPINSEQNLSCLFEGDGQCESSTVQEETVVIDPSQSRFITPVSSEI